MASIVNDPNGLRRIQFFGSDGKRRTIRLGRVTRKQAEAVSARIERLVAATIVSHPPDDETSRWLADLDDILYAKLAAAGLARPREGLTLGGWVAKYVASRNDLKPASVYKLQQTGEKLLRFFSPNTPLRAITVDQAADWRQWLLGEGLSEATVRQQCRNAKTIFAEAVERGLLPQSPVRNLKSGVIAATNDRYISPDEADRVLAACPNEQWRLLFALARFAGLRTPSETHLLTWADVDWGRGRLTVRSPKTEHFAGKEQRIVPITRRLMPILQQAFDSAGEGEERVITLSRNNLRRGLQVIARRAGIPPWEDTYQTLRRSCEVEWAQSYPQFAVSRWIGHSITVSGKHYANSVPDELFDRAASEGLAEAAQKAAQQGAATACTGGKTEGAGETPAPVSACGCDALQPHFSSSGRTRTGDLGLMNPALYQLSYAAEWAKECIKFTPADKGRE